MSFESQLTDSLRRKTPPPDFAAGVMAAIARAEAPRRGPFARGGWMAVAATFLVATLGGITAHQVQQRREGERAKEQLMLAMHLTSKKLRETQQHVHEVSSR